jgi:hypothetical protein
MGATDGFSKPPEKCTQISSSVSDQNPDGSAFNLSLDPGSGSGFWIQMSKNRFKKPKFTMTDFKDKNRKCSD